MQDEGDGDVDFDDDGYGDCVAVDAGVTMMLLEEVICLRSCEEDL